MAACGMGAWRLVELIGFPVVTAVKSVCPPGFSAKSCARAGIRAPVRKSSARKYLKHPRLVHPCLAALTLNGETGEYTMQAILQQAYTTKDFTRDAASKLRAWTCRWTFALYKSEDGFRYEASCESAPGEVDTDARNVPEAELAALVWDLARMDASGLFTKAVEERK